MGHPPLTDSAFDAAFWLLDRALDDNEYLNPRKLHRLLYLAQAYYAVANAGHSLMPATFVADPDGPLEPTLFRAFAYSRPRIDLQPIPDRGKQLLDSIWRRFGAHSTDHLTKALKRHAPYADAYAQAPRTVIEVAALVAFYGRAERPEQGIGALTSQGAPHIEQVLRPRVMRSQSGRPVSVHQWRPRTLKDQ
ncbi:hypothetical protein F1188_03650 [Roseospira marina]|uniref:DUF4065 domain-containing protein n=1 Tax=Roseospira marina TaxID=140057 RepID=A0A5M6IFV4_9PROT|nr:SocA family protein [Roseospira marina]KAA5607012.1 hypothetical protein F1188_03650 [Roseospira marina]MBB4312804.1 putative phage-associated protein [Roseospira marina]MBB5086423.1 putative phage-associated protein [Roseospira marina]